MPSVNRNRVIGSFEDAIERGQTDIKKTTRNQIGDFSNTTQSQLTGKSPKNNIQAQQAQGDPSGAQPKETSSTGDAKEGKVQPEDNQMTDEDRKKFLSELYGVDLSSDSNTGRKDGKKDKGKSDKKDKNSGDVKQALGMPEKDPHKGMKPEDIAKLEALRQQLHGNYYQEFLEKSKSKDQPVKEKLEQEEQEKKMEELEMQKDKDKKKLPVTVKQGTAETSIGTVG